MTRSPPRLPPGPVVVLLVALLWLAAARAGALGTPREAEPPPAPAPRPGIVLLMADDLGWGDVGFNGNRVIRTPSLDDMARSGLVLRRFYSAAPVCSPTRGSVLTGRHPYRYGIRFANVGHLPARELSLAELFAELGYRTGHFGKWHLGTLTRAGRDSNRGGARNLEHYSPPWRNGFQVAFSTEAKARARAIAFESGGQLALSRDRYKIYRPAGGRGRRGRRRRTSSPEAAPDDRPRFELYDLQSDPGETRDLARQHPDIVRRMAAELEAWRASCRESFEKTTESERRPSARR